MQSQSSRVHQETRHILEKHPSLNQKKTLVKKIAQRLNILRKYRKYGRLYFTNPKNIKQAYNRRYLISKRIFELLEELN